MNSDFFNYSRELTSLARSLEFVQKCVARSNGTLVHESGTIGPVGILLEESVPVLWL